MTTPQTLTPSWKKTPLLRIDAVVAAHLGETRVRGNAQPAVFHRQIAMYLAKQIGGWSYKTIRRFYNGRDHSTVHYAIRRITEMRESTPDLDALLSRLQQAIVEATGESVCRQPSVDLQRTARRVVALAKNETVLDALAERVASKLRAELREIVSLVQKETAGGPREPIESTGPPKVSELLDAFHGNRRGQL
jgi:hypothetical protein